MKNNINKIGVIMITSVSLFLSACGTIDPTPKAINLEKTLSKMSSNYSLKIKVNDGDTLKGIIVKLQKQFPNKIFVDKIENDIIFDQSLPEMTPEEFSKYIKLNFGKIIILRKYSEKIFAIEEISTKEKTSSIINGNYKIPNKKFKINGKFSYEEVFNILREKGVNIYIDTEESFDYSKSPGEFSGSVKEFLSYVSSKEKLFVIREDRGIKLKDKETVTYNLKIPKVKLSPVLSPDGTKTAVTITGSVSGSVAEASAGNGSISPIDDLEKQFDSMLKGKSIYAINMSQGTISVTGNYEAIKIADKLVEDFNSIYGKGIKLELHVYEVSLDNSKAFGIDYSLLRTKLVNGVATPTTSLATSLTSALNIGGTAAAGATLTLNKQAGALKAADGSLSSAKTQSLIFKYLNQFGKTSVITKPTLETINNLPVKLDVVNSVDYVYTLEQSANSTAVSGVDSPVNLTTTYKPEIKTVTTGFSLVLHPKVQGDFINIAIKNISSTLNSLTAYTYGSDNENVIRLKDVSAREFDETVKIKEGEIAIIGGYMYKKKHSLKNGMPYTDENDSALDALTSAKETEKHKVEIVVTITAKVI